MDIQTMYENFVMNTYKRDPRKTLLIKRGSGARVWDENGKEFLDFVGGLAVNALGHCHPRVVEAIKQQADELIHTSNLYYTENQAELARRISKSSLKGQVFFSNSGAEANEAAIKAARKYVKDNYGKERYKIITALRSFHGRTLATITATGQERFQKGFEPLPEGFVYAPFNDLEAFKGAVDDETCAIMVEPLQGEGGVYTAEKEFIQGLRQLCDENNLLLIFDEVQSGMGRTGTLWAYEQYGVEPDILTSAKALGGGLPISATVCKPEVSSALGPGDHASTFGGNPVACRAALAVMGALLDEGLLAEVNRKSESLQDKLNKISSDLPGVIKEIRGRGLILGIELNGIDAPSVQMECQEKGLLVNAIGENTIRILPPYVISEEDMEEFARILKETLETGDEKDERKI